MRSAALVRGVQPLQLAEAAGQVEDGVQALVAQAQQGDRHLAQGLVARRHGQARLRLGELGEFVVKDYEGEAWKKRASASRCRIVGLSS